MHWGDSKRIVILWGVYNWGKANFHHNNNGCMMQIHFRRLRTLRQQHLRTYAGPYLHIHVNTQTFIQFEQKCIPAYIYIYIVYECLSCIIHILYWGPTVWYLQYISAMKTGLGWPCTLRDVWLSTGRSRSCCVLVMCYTFSHSLPSLTLLPMYRPQGCLAPAAS